MFQRRSPSASPSTATTSPDAELGQKSPIKRRVRKSLRTKRSTNVCPIVVPVVGLCLVGGLMTILLIRGNDGNGALSRALMSVSKGTTTSEDDANLYQCPSVTAQDDRAVNFDPVRFKNHYLKEHAHTAELEHFIANFRDTPYDDWGQTYTHMKDGMTHWKQRAFVPHVRSGDKIYESAIGMGLNAYMTLEILRKENPSLEDVSMYGNEYLLTSTVRANEFFDRMLPAVGFRKGNVCVGDSTNITYVPSNSFDLVYTGYILPIGNPLQFDQPDKDPFMINHGRYHELCDGTGWRDVTLRDLAQRKQEDFYAAWTGEMIRIAKPGHPIIIEHVSQPKCDDREDWGGVAKSWWYEAIDRYNWPIDPDSIFMEDDRIYSFNRYHVFMRKTK